MRTVTEKIVSECDQNYFISDFVRFDGAVNSFKVFSVVFLEYRFHWNIEIEDELFVVKKDKMIIYRVLEKIK